MTRPSLPKVSVIWVSGYRGTAFVDLVNDFLDRTTYPSLETLVVDWSVGDSGVTTRDAIAKSGLFDQVILQNRRACGSGNRNLGIMKAHGDLILLLEDDVRLKRSVGQNWLTELVDDLTAGNWDDFCLWDSSATSPSVLASLSTQKSIQKQIPFPSYPSRFRTITKSQREACGLITQKYRSLGLRCKGFSLVETSLSMPSFNLARQRDLRGLSYRALDRMVKRGAASVRQPDIDWVDHAQYQALGGWEGCEFRIIDRAAPSQQSTSSPSPDRRRYSLIEPLQRVSDWIFETAYRVLAFAKYFRRSRSNTRPDK